MTVSRRFSFSSLLLATAAALAAASAASAPVEMAIEAPSPAGALKGTLLEPVNRRGPVVLIIPGSGQVDRNGNGAQGLNASTYRLIAEGLASESVTTVRSAKRGMDGSARAGNGTVTIGDYAADVRSWVRVIRRKTGAPCVWLLGHSEGGLVALSAGQGAEGVCGLILVAAPGRPMGEVLREQLIANSATGPVLGLALSMIGTLEKGEHFHASAADSALLPVWDLKMQDLLISEFSLDPARLIQTCRLPILIVQGERDMQVSVADAERLKQAAPGSRLLLLPDTNHVLKTVASEDWATNSAAYSDPHLPLAPGVVEGIAGFIRPVSHASAKASRLGHR